MSSFSFVKLRESFVSKNVTVLKNDTKELVQFLLSSSYLDDKTYYHPLGFIYSKLFEFADGETIRIHMWDRNFYQQKPFMHIHNHFYTVNSFLYLGCITNNVFRISNECGKRYSIYEGAYSKDEDRVLRRTDNEIFLTLDHTSQYCAKELYQISADSIHSGFPLDMKPVCTIVYTEKPGIPKPLILGPVDGEFEYYFPTKPVEPKIIRKLMQVIEGKKNE